MGAHEQTSPSRESGGPDPTDVEKTDEEEDIKDMKPSVETPKTLQIVLGAVVIVPSFSVEGMRDSCKCSSSLEHHQVGKRGREEEVRRDESEEQRWDGRERITGVVEGTLRKPGAEDSEEEEDEEEE